MASTFNLMFFLAFSGEFFVEGIFILIIYNHSYFYERKSKR